MRLPSTLCLISLLGSGSSSSSSSSSSGRNSWPIDLSTAILLEEIKANQKVRSTLRSLGLISIRQNIQTSDLVKLSLFDSSTSFSPPQSRFVWLPKCPRAEVGGSIGVCEWEFNCWLLVARLAGQGGRFVAPRRAPSICEPRLLLEKAHLIRS